jgi:hypothetical protein
LEGAGSLEGLRSSGRIDEPAVAELHDHVAWFGDGLDDLYRLAVRALAAGARRGDKLLFVADDPDPSRLRGVDALDESLENHRLELLATESVYSARDTFSAATQLAAFQTLLDQALGLGYRGLRVVADNTLLACGSDDDYDRWLRWEQVTDRFQAGAPITGFCYFDRGAVPRDRQVTLAALHPLRSGRTPEPPFTFTATDSGRAVTGSLDAFSAGQFRRAIAAFPDDEPLIVSLSAAEFVDHRAVLTLAEAASAGRPVIIRHASSVVKRIVALLEVEAPYLIFE